MSKFIGDKKIELTEELDEKTDGGVPLVRVTYATGESEVLSKLMFDHIASRKPMTASELRDLRVQVVVEKTLALCREWGIKVGETPYFGQMLNMSLNYNVDQAELILWSAWTQKPRERDDVSLIDVDRVLRSARPTLKEVLDDKA